MSWLKTGVFVLVGIAVFAFLHRVALTLLNPVGGGEFHLIFAYSQGGRLGTAIWVLIESIVISLVLALGFRALRAPVPWWVLASIATAVPSLHWYQILNFESASGSFRTYGFAAAPLIPAALFGGLWLVERRIRATRQASPPVAA